MASSHCGRRSRDGGSPNGNKSGETDYPEGFRSTNTSKHQNIVYHEKAMVFNLKGLLCTISKIKLFFKKKAISGRKTTFDRSYSSFFPSPSLLRRRTNLDLLNYPGKESEAAVI